MHGASDRDLERVPQAEGPLRRASTLVWQDLPDEAGLLDLLGGAGAPLDFARARIAGHGVPRIRPLLVALSARAAGAERVDPQLQHAAELLHLTLAVHDLALGEGEGRRRRVARRLLHGSVSWLGGNHLTLRALELARHGASPHVLGEMLDTLREVSEAAALARELQLGAVPDEGDWREHAGGHAGAVFAFCCRGGALLADPGAAHVSSLGRYGRHLGRLWSAAEDCAALRREEAGEWLRARAGIGRPVLPVVLAGARDPAVAVAWSRVVREPESSDIAPLVEAGRDALHLARRVMVREAWSARRALSDLPKSPYRDGLDRLAADLARPSDTTAG